MPLLLGFGLLLLLNLFELVKLVVLSISVSWNVHCFAILMGCCKWLLCELLLVAEESLYRGTSYRTCHERSSLFWGIGSVDSVAGRPRFTLCEGIKGDRQAAVVRVQKP